MRTVFLKKIITRSPRLHALLQTLKLRLQGLPPVEDAAITSDVLLRCIETSEPTILDIGCNDGTHTLWLHSIFKNAVLYCFEPDPRAIQRFKKLVGRSDSITLFEMVLSDRNGEVRFYQSNGRRDASQAEIMPEGWDLSGSIRQPKEHLNIHPWVGFEKQITVASTTLDSWCEAQDIDHIDLIWMDVQGAEIDVFRGAEKTLARTRYIYTEYSNLELYKGQYNLRRLMRHLKHYEIVARYPTDVLLRNTRFK